MKTVFVVTFEDISALVVLVGIIIGFLVITLKHFILKWRVERIRKKEENQK